MARRGILRLMDHIRRSGLKISDKTGLIVKHLSDLDLVDMAKGFYDEGRASRNSRMKPTSKLIHYFKDAKIRGCLFAYF